MDAFKLWIISLCGATAITSLFKILLSKSSINKVINIFFSIFILLYTVMPIQALLSENKFKLSIKNDDTEYNETYKNSFDKIIEASIKNLCQSQNVEVVGISINSYYDDGFLYVESIVLDIDKNESASVISEKLEQQLGYEVSVK